MSRCPDSAGRRPIRGSAGFTLIEVIVAIGIMVLVTAALTPQIVVGLRTAGIARDVTQAKGVAQARLEQIRNMPYFVGRSAGDYIDMLDTYYRNTAVPTTAPTGCGGTTLAALPPTSWTGYVPADGARCVWEPPTGAFYRRVVNPISAPGLGAFAMVVSTQFLSSKTPPTPLPPLTGYDSQVAGKDAPASSQVGVTVAVFYTSHTGVRFMPTYTQVERSTPVVPLLESRSRTTTVSVSSATQDGTLLQQQLGVVNLTGELFTGSRVVLSAAAGTASSSSGEQAAAAALDLVAPADTTSTNSTKDSSALSDGCARMCFGKSMVDQASALAGGGLPRAGTATAPVRARVIKNSGGSEGFTFSNGADETRLQLVGGTPLVSVDTKVEGSLPVVKNCLPDAANGTHPAYLSGTGFLAATADDVESCGTGQTTTIRLFPTTYIKDRLSAERGVVEIVLRHAAAHCKVTRATGSVTKKASYAAELSYFDGTGYTSLELGSHRDVDPLAGVPMDTGMGSGELTLASYISSWKSLTASGMKTASTSRSAEAAVPGAITIITQPTREGDPSSAVSLTVGSASCAVGDRR